MNKNNRDNAPEGMKNALNYWNNKAQKSSTDCERVEQSKRTQLMRYEAFLQLHDLAGKSLLDVGCGAGDLWQHLQRKNIACSYAGFDLSPFMIQRCRERFPRVTFEDGNFLEWGKNKLFDYTIAIGIHNIKVEDGWNVFQQVTKRQFELSKIAAHISILTDRYHGFAPHIQAWKAEEVLKMALEITPFVVLRHDYLPHDFSVTLYREPLIDSIDFDFDKYCE
jgi:ubiquinone/menaquinone biosynthesis C-methylase UbiE